MVERALGELRGCGLLEGSTSEAPGYSRREATVRLAKIGGAAFAAPLIYSVAVGPAMAAASAAPNQGAIVCNGGPTGNTHPQDVLFGTCVHLTGTQDCAC